MNKNFEYLKNDNNNYVLPDFCYNLNNMTKILEKSLPKNDSRFRKDMKLLEEGDIDKAQEYKLKYEEKQRKELNNENHQILFFNEINDEENEVKYYEPNGIYWMWKKNGKLKDNPNFQIFDVSGY